MIVVDTSVWIPFLHDFTGPAAQKLRAAIMTSEVVVGDIVLLEILRGARTDLHAKKLEQALARFPIVNMFDPAIARAAAANYRRLRSLGITVRKVPDVIIATFCIEHHYRLLHEDRDFDHFEQHFGLEVLH